MSDSDEELLLLCYLRNSREDEEEKPKKSRKSWVNERIEESKREFGEYGLVKGLSSKEDQIVQNFNMLPADFYELFELIKNDIEKASTCLRNPIPGESRLSVALRYLTGKENMRGISTSLGIGKCTTGTIIHETCAAICKALKPIVMPELSMEKLCESAAKMKELTQFPNCVGVLDGKHLFTRKYYQPNRNKGLQDKSGIVLFGLADATCCFMAINILSHSNFDSQAEADLLSTVLDGMIPEESMPPPNLLPESGTFLPHIVLGNECFPLNKYLMTPYTVEDLLQDPNKGIYNKMHCQALEVSGYTIGLMTQRYKFFQNRNVLNTETRQFITEACCYLHNFIQMKDLQRNNPQNFIKQTLETLEDAPFEPLKPYVEPGSKIGQEVRENFLSYFSAQSNILIKEEISIEYD